MRSRNFIRVTLIAQAQVETPSHPYDSADGMTAQAAELELPARYPAMSLKSDQARQKKELLNLDSELL